MTSPLSDSDARKWDDSQVRRQASFLQSAFWGKFQAAAGSAPHFIMEKNWSCLLLERHTPLGNYLFAPYGPTLTSPSDLSGAVVQIKEYAKQYKFDWLVIEPICPDHNNQSLAEGLAKLGARRSDHNREPDLTRVIDLKPPADELLAAISQSTRSFIRKNQREKFISFRTSTAPDDIAIFTTMLNQITQRKKVRFFSDDYFKTEAEILMPAGMMFLEIALQDGKPVASALFHDYGQLSTYTYAASLPDARSVNGSALLLWQAMLNAKDRGIKKLDLYGIAPDDAPSSHPWAGFTAFKRKFGGEAVRHAGSWDIPISWRYRGYRTVKSARKILRRH